MQKIIIVFLVFINLIYPVYATNELVENEPDEKMIETATYSMLRKTQNALGISDFLKEAKVYTKSVYENLDLEKAFSSVIKGDYRNIFSKKLVFRLLGKDIASSVRLMINILVIIVIHTILKSIIENIGNESSAKIAYFVQYLMIVSLVIQSFSSVLQLTKETISNLCSFINLLIPLLTTLMITTGCINISNIFQPFILFLSSSIGNLFSSIIIPILLVSISISVVSNISDKVQLNKLSKFLRSSAVWLVGIVLTAFTGLISVESTLGSSVDELASKTTKATISNLIPVVGKILGDTTEAVIGCTNILKNAVGVIGLLIILGIVLVPIIKILILWIMFLITSAACEIIADEKIVKLIDQIADSYKVLLAILFSISVIFFISISIAIKISNNVVM